MPSLRGLPRRGHPRKLPEIFDPKIFLTHPGRGRATHHYLPKQAIFSQGERAEALFYVQEGRAKLSVVSKQGKEATIALLGPGDFLGEGCIASDQAVYMATGCSIRVKSDWHGRC